jgi:hypothetical protein
MDGWIYFLFGVILGLILRESIVLVNHAFIEFRRKRLLKLVNIRFPDNEEIALISIDATDKRAMAKLERELREQYDIPEEKDDDYRRDRG